MVEIVCKRRSINVKFASTDDMFHKLNDKINIDGLDQENFIHTKYLSINLAVILLSVLFAQIVIDG